MPTILLVHGYHRTAARMQVLADALRSHGFYVLTPDLPTTKERLDTCVQCLETFLDRHNLQALPQPLHLVGHSYGGLILRGLLARRILPNLASLTCMGSSHQGTRVANFFTKFGIHKREKALLEFCIPGPPIAPPLQGWPAKVHLLAGCVYNKLWTGFFLPKPNDGRLPVESALALGKSGQQIPFPAWTLRTILSLDHHQLENHPELISALVNGYSDI